MKVRYFFVAALSLLVVFSGCASRYEWVKKDIGNPIYAQTYTWKDCDITVLKNSDVVAIHAREKVEGGRIEYEQYSKVYHGILADSTTFKRERPVERINGFLGLGIGKETSMVLVDDPFVFYRMCSVATEDLPRSVKDGVEIKWALFMGQ